MTEQNLSALKHELITKLSSTMQRIESIKHDDLIEHSQRYQHEEDPYGVAIHDLIFRPIIGILD